MNLTPRNETLWNNVRAAARKAPLMPSIEPTLKILREWEVYQTSEALLDHILANLRGYRAALVDVGGQVPKAQAITSIVLELEVIRWKHDR